MFAVEENYLEQGGMVEIEVLDVSLLEFGFVSLLLGG